MRLVLDANTGVVESAGHHCVVVPLPVSGRLVSDTMNVLTPAELREVLLGLRTLRNQTKRSIERNTSALARWTDEQEASNPGYREFLTRSIEKRSERLERIHAATQKLPRLER